MPCWVNSTVWASAQPWRAIRSPFSSSASLASSSQTVEDLPDDLAETASETIENAIDTLNDHAPDGWRLGFSEADGSDLCWQPVSLRAQLQAVGSRWVADDWDKRSQNDASTTSSTGSTTARKRCKTLTAPTG